MSCADGQAQAADRKGSSDSALDQDAAYHHDHFPSVRLPMTLPHGGVTG